MVTELTPEMSGRKITCKIDGKLIEGEILYKNKDYFILNNIKNGGNLLSEDKKNYLFDWGVGAGSKNHLKVNNTKDIQFVYKTLELW